MLYEDLELPKTYWDKKISKISGATGPAFICPFSFIFDSEKSIEEAILFHNKRIGSIKGLSLYVPSDKIWLVFVFGKFQSIEAIEPNSSTVIADQNVYIKMDI